jgi:hypothetical protein
MEEHTFKYEGLEITVFGDYENPDDTTGYKGGFSVALIEVNGVDIIWMLKPNVIERITYIVNEIR